MRWTLFQKQTVLVILHNRLSPDTDDDDDDEEEEEEEGEEELQLVFLFHK